MKRFVAGLTAGMLMFGGVAWASDYVGDLCWSFSNPTQGTSGTIRLGISHIGGGHYLTSGVASVTTPIVVQVPVHGNVEIIGGEIVSTLTAPGSRNGVIGNDMQKIKLNSSTLNGSFESIGVYSDAVEISNGTLTHTPCP